MSIDTAPSYIIRKARPADLEILLALENNCFQSDCISRRRMRHWIGADNGVMLVAQIHGAANESVSVRLAGYCLAITRRGSRKLRVYSLAIAAAARGKGLGARLLTRLEQEGRKRGCTSIVLEVADDNAGAIRLYEKLHYQRFDKVPGYYEDGRTALRMRKALVV